MSVLLAVETLYCELFSKRTHPPIRRTDIFRRSHRGLFFFTSAVDGDIWQSLAALISSGANDSFIDLSTGGGC